MHPTYGPLQLFGNGWAFVTVVEWRGLPMSHVARSVCLHRDACLCVRHIGELCKNGWTDRDAVQGQTRVGLTKEVSYLGVQSHTRKVTFDGDIVRMFLARCWPSSDRQPLTSGFFCPPADCSSATRPINKLLYTLVYWPIYFAMMQTCSLVLYSAHAGNNVYEIKHHTSRPALRPSNTQVRACTST